MKTTPSSPGSGLAPATAPASGSRFAQYMQRMRSGELGSLPIILGLILIVIVFQVQNQNFLTPRNFVNLIVQMAGITTIAIGVVYVLLLGEIDLSIGYVSAVAAVSMALLLREPISLPWPLAVVVALLVAAAVGALHGSIITRFQVPSFVVTLAGLLAWNGVVLILMQGAGTVIIQDQTVLNIANAYLPPALGWALALGGVALFAYSQFTNVRARNQRGLTNRSTAITIVQVALVALLSLGAVYFANLDRGVPFIGLLLLILLAAFSVLATRTKFGRYVYAIGGNKEAARRAGINVERIRVMVFMISSVMAGVGGIILASRLRSVDTAAGGGNLLINSIAAAVIGGTSLFGGRGKVSSAFLGALIIASIENGMGLLNLSAGEKFVITGLVLLAAVLVDATSRRGQGGAKR
ncbi:MAG: ABC transporter permease [Roseiflexaceae bacterium]|nr:ABC transporter permease [Roseiflexaceae bacterium]